MAHRIVAWKGGGGMGDREKKGEVVKERKEQKEKGREKNDPTSFTIPVLSSSIYGKNLKSHEIRIKIRTCEASMILLNQKEKNFNWFGNTLCVFIENGAEAAGRGAPRSSDSYVILAC